MKRKNPKPLTDAIEMIYEEEMHELADAITECSQNVSAFSDPFEEYIDFIRAKTHSNPHLFRSRLTKGYNALLQALQNIENSQENPKES